MRLKCGMRKSVAKPRASVLSNGALYVDYAARQRAIRNEPETDITGRPALKPGKRGPDRPDRRAADERQLPRGVDKCTVTVIGETRKALPVGAPFVLRSSAGTLMGSTERWPEQMKVTTGTTRYDQLARNGALTPPPSFGGSIESGLSPFAIFKTKGPARHDLTDQLRCMPPCGSRRSFPHGAEVEFVDLLSWSASALRT